MSIHTFNRWSLPGTGVLVPVKWEIRLNNFWSLFHCEILWCQTLLRICWSYGQLIINALSPHPLNFSTAKVVLSIFQHHRAHRLCHPNTAASYGTCLQWQSPHEHAHPGPLAGGFQPSQPPLHGREPVNRGECSALFSLSVVFSPTVMMQLIAESTSSQAVFFCLFSDGCHIGGLGKAWFLSGPVTELMLFFMSRKF